MKSLMMFFMNDVAIAPNHADNLDEHGNPGTWATKVRMVVCNELINKINP